ncbi:P-loop containing nucleoside triphosphate hydrolase protein [Apiospora aurea]|uniref:P-loop containing nucleoside triphosphate hydrolase protein n=1 Tax=Apiospora aurea TaxID=335848 RepID=A0ABR1QZ89_9PEZI
MTRPRGASAASEDSSNTVDDQELGSMYDYLAKVVLLGPSGTGKSCLLHRFVKSEWRILSSQTIGVEFASKIIKVGTGARRKRIKLQLWDTAGTERFRSVSRSYYRGAAGAVLIYDVTSHASFRALPPFLNDARALASPNLTTLLVGNKLDLANDQGPLLPELDEDLPSPPPQSSSSFGGSMYGASVQSSASVNTITPSSIGLGTQQRATIAPEGREVSAAEASRWAGGVNVPVALEVFARLARAILTKIELGEIDPDDPLSGIQYGDGGHWMNGGGVSDAGSVKSGMTMEDGGGGGGAGMRKRKKGRRGTVALREWEEVFTLRSGRRRGCC